MQSTAIVMLPLVIVPVLVAQGVAAVPPPVPQRTARCDAPTYASDFFVCGDEDLRTRDARLSRLYDVADRAGLVDRAPYLEPADTWFGRRSLCAFRQAQRDCLTAAYRERVAVVSALLTPRPGRGMDVACGTTRARGTWIRGQGELDVLVLDDVSGRPLGAAVIDEGEPDWHPFLSATVSGRDLHLVRGTDRTACRMTTRFARLSDASLRIRVEAIDRRALQGRSDYESRRLTRGAYVARIQALRLEEEELHAEAALRVFDDPATEAYWHRGRLKFPTVSALALQRLDDEPRP